MVFSFVIIAMVYLLSIFAKSKFRVYQGCILNLKFIFLPPPPFLIYIFQPFFLQFCVFEVNWRKNMHTFYQLGEKYAFSPLFYPLSIIFFPQPVILQNRKIYTPGVYIMERGKSRRKPLVNDTGEF